MRRTILLGMVQMAGQWSKLSKAWTKNLAQSSAEGRVIGSAIERTLPMLEDPTAVPFVCRYRSDVIAPLSTKQIHQLSDMMQKHRSLESLRKRILPYVVPTDDMDLLFRVETSISKTELEDIYAPFKPPSKGSLEERIKQEHPKLVADMDAFWSNGGDATGLKFVPREAAITLLANRIANHLPIMDAALEYTKSYCRIKGSRSASSKAASKKSSSTKKDDDEADKYRTYFDFDSSFHHIRDHQVLALRRGIDHKVLKLSYDIDSSRAEPMIRHAVVSSGVLGGGKHHYIWKEAIHDAWSRLVRKRCTSRLWKKHCILAEERAIQVFCDNLRKALLAPPATDISPVVFAVDPGFQAGIKCALLDSSGNLLTKKKNALSTVSFMRNHEKGKKQMIDLLQSCQPNTKGQVVVALGNGHGTQEARKLVTESSEECGIAIDLRLVSEAGASVWSVTEAANVEFPTETAAAIASVSIGRRYLNPMAELVKIPPRSLGLGMYQHDLTKKDLDEKLHITSVDAVAEVGVEANSCSAEILEKVPGITKVLCGRIISARPLRKRSDLLEISGLGPKTFENCAAFIRVNGKDELDATLVHPESYDLARWLLKKFKWNLKDPSSLGTVPTRKDRKHEWKDVVKRASARFNCTEERVNSVIDHLINSIASPDPRLREVQNTDTNYESVANYTTLPSNLASQNELRKACPMRGVVATVRNVVDFGAFVDFGGENDGLLHRSKLGKISLGSLMVGQEIGIDILGVSRSSKVSVSIAGLGLPREDLDERKRANPNKRSVPTKPPAKRQRKK